MDVYLTDLQDPGVQVTYQGGHAPGLAGHATDQDGQAQAINQGGRAAGLAGRDKVSRARAVLTFVPVKTLTAANVASQSGLRAAGGRRRGTIERTVSTRAYGSWAMFVKAFQNTIRVFSHRRALGVSWGRGVLSRLGALRLARACTRVYVYVLGARVVGALRLFAGPVFAVTFTQLVGRGLRLVSAIAFAREPIKPKPARSAQNVAKLITGAGGLGKYAEVMRQKQLPLRLATLQKACTALEKQPIAVFSVGSVGCGRRCRSNVRRSLRKTTYSGLKGPQISTYLPSSRLDSGSRVAAPGVAELIVEESRLVCEGLVRDGSCEVLKGVKKALSQVGDSCVVWQILVEEWLARMSSGL
jgi:hypothetical protein